MQIVKKNKLRYKSRLVIAGVITLIIASILIYVLVFKGGFLNLTTKAPSNATNSSPDGSTKDNIKPTTTNKIVNDTNTKNQSGSSSNTNDTTTTNIAITYSFAGQDTPGGAVLIRTILDNANSEQCTYKLTKGSIEKDYSNQAIFSGTYYSCNYNVPYSDLSNGTWNLTVSAKQDSIFGTASTDVEVK